MTKGKPSKEKSYMQMPFCRHPLVLFISQLTEAKSYECIKSIFITFKKQAKKSNLK